MARKQITTVDAELMVATKESPQAFAEMFLFHMLLVLTPGFHKEIYKLLLEQRRLVLASPRGFAKSTLVSVIYPIWLAVWGGAKDICIISASETLAVDWLRKIKRELADNSLIREYFGPQESDKWSENHIILRNGVNIRARGAGGQIRGFRPDVIICHKKGTKILSDTGWIKVEDYPNAKEVVADGCEVGIYGVPDKEVVTKEHRYWSFKQKSRRGVETKPNWVEARDLTIDSYIGYPINKTCGGIPTLSVYKPGVIKSRDSFGRVISAGGNYEFHNRAELYDKDWWWLIGLWWGDGHIAGKHQIGLTIANKDVHVYAKVKTILSKYDIKHSIIKKDGCFQVVFCHSVFNRWLKSWRIGNSRKTPPEFVEYMDLDFQKELIKGYIAADGYVDYKNNQVRLTSIHLDGLYVVKNILARIGVPSSIRNGIDAKEVVILGRKCNMQKKYDLRFRKNAKLLGYGVKDQTRYSKEKIFIKDGFLWSKVKDIKDIESETFCPIKTDSGTYITRFGLSHNCDDLETDDGVRSEEQRRILKDWLFKACLNTLTPDGQFIIIGTVLHPLSLLSDLLSSDIGWYRKKYMAYSDGVQEEGHELWSELWPHVKIQQRKREIGSFRFASEFMNSPISDETAPIKEHQIRTWTELPKQFNAVIAVDPAYSEDDTADWKTASLILCDSNANRYLAHYIRMHGKIGEFQDAIINLWLSHRGEVTAIGIPNSGVEKAFFESFLRKCGERKLYPPVMELKNSFVQSGTGISIRNKTARVIAALQPLFEQGKYYIGEAHSEARDELMSIGFSKHDDIVDTLAYAENLIQPYMGSSVMNSDGDNQFLEISSAGDYGYSGRVEPQYAW